MDSAISSFLVASFTLDSALVSCEFADAGGSLLLIIALEDRQALRRWLRGKVVPDSRHWRCRRHIRPTTRPLHQVSRSRPV